MDKAHRSPYSTHPGLKKMYKTLKKVFFWPRMKKEMAAYVAHCLECQQVKAEHHHPTGLLQPHDIPESKWEFISMDFVVGLPTTPQRHDCIMVVVDKLTKSAHFIPKKSTFEQFNLCFF